MVGFLWEIVRVTAVDPDFHSVLLFGLRLDPCEGKNHTDCGRHRLGTTRTIVMLKWGTKEWLLR
jgi:hypothetical protein